MTMFQINRLLCRKLLILCVLTFVLPTILGISTTHYNKPLERKPPRNTIKLIKFPQRFNNLTNAERQKRLLPYINFYVSQPVNQPYHEDQYNTNQRYRLIPPPKLNYQPVQPDFADLVAYQPPPDSTYPAQEILYQPQGKFTPFLESNALPGPFVPMVNQQPQKVKVSYTPRTQREKIPNFSLIYDKLSQLKLQHTAADNNNHQQQPNTRYNTQQYLVKKPQLNFIPVHEFQEQLVEPPTTFVHTYTPTDIEIVTEKDVQTYQSQQYDDIEESKNQQNKQHTILHEPIIKATNNNGKPYIQENIALVQEQPIRLSTQPQYVSTLTKYPQTHYLVEQLKQYHNQNHKQYLQETLPQNKFILIPQQPYHPIEYKQPDETQAAKPILILEPTGEQSYTPQPIISNYQPVANSHHRIPEIQTENPNSLSHILKSLQDSNALPHTLTPDNIDNSIKTLVKILNSLKKTNKLQTQPIVVAENDGDFQEHINEAGVELGHTHYHGHPPGTSVQTYPAHTPEGGTPGKPGVDYPALSSIPQTNFNCKTQRYKGFFADPDTHCQVWHYCDLNGGQASFLCPNGTIFSQVALTCDWWFNVKCSTTTQLYVLNERLYKYIIPLTPKFPEDYTGPLVDRYLALKFREMEEKMKKEKEKEMMSSESSETETEKDEIQLLQDKNDEQAKIALEKMVMVQK